MADQAIATPWMRTTLLNPKLSADAERELLNRARADDKTALEALMISQFKTVFHIARRYPHMGGFDLDDNIQEGFLGLLRAIKKFNPDKGVCLATYASHWVNVTISRALTSKSHLIRLPVHAQVTLSHITRTANLLSEELQRSPTDEELAERLGVDMIKMRTLQETWRPAVSLDDDAFFDSESSLHEMIPCGLVKTMCLGWRHFPLQGAGASCIIILHVIDSRAHRISPHQCRLKCFNISAIFPVQHTHLFGSDRAIGPAFVGQHASP